MAHLVHVAVAAAAAAAAAAIGAEAGQACVCRQRFTALTSAAPAPP